MPELRPGVEVNQFSLHADNTTVSPTCAEFEAAHKIMAFHVAYGTTFSNITVLVFFITAGIFS